jgi:Domain of unknown function (DUF4352)
VSPLTPQERRRIYEEEKARIEAQELIRARMTAVAASKQAKAKAEADARAGADGESDPANPDLIYWMGGDDGARVRDRGEPTGPPPARTIRPGRVIAVIAAAFMLLLAYAVYATGESKIRAALTAFQQHLAIEDFPDAANDLHTAQSVFKAHPDVRRAEGELRHGIAQAKRYQQGLAFLRTNQPAKAIAVLEPIRGYRDVATLIADASYRAAKQAIEAKQWAEARGYLAGLDPDSHDVSVLWAQVNDALAAQYYSDAMTAKSNKDYGRAITLLEQSRSVGGRPSDGADRELAVIRRLHTQETGVRGGQERRAERARTLMAMARFQGAPLAVAVRAVHISTAVSTRLDSYIAANGYQFVWLELAVRNTGTRVVHSEPNDFTLSPPAGVAVNPQADATHRLSNALFPADLPPKASVTGYLIFHVPKRDAYELQVDASTNHLRKLVVATEWRY